MSDHGTPAQVRPGFVVRIKLHGSLCYSSTRMTLNEAQALSTRTRELATGYVGSFIDFPAADYQALLVRAEHIRSIEVRAVAADGGAYTAAVELLQSFKDDELREAQR